MYTRQSQWLCFWRKSNELSLNVCQTERMESEIEQAEKAIEVSHGSAGEFSRSAANQALLKRNCSSTILFTFTILVLVTVSVLLPVFWFGSVPKISEYMKRWDRYRLPITIVTEVFSFFLICLCVVQLVQKGRSLQRRVSYLSSYSNDTYTSRFDPNATPSSFSSSSRVLRPADGIVKQFSYGSPAGIYAVALRQILEELPDECIERVQELARRFLDSGNGRSSLASEKFTSNRHTSVDSNTHVYRVAVKVLLLGDINVGKTSIFHRILYDQFSSSYLQTIGADLGFSTLNFSSKDESDQLSVGLQIWDIGGQEHLARATKQYYKDAVIIIPVADIGNAESLHAVQYWLQDVMTRIYDPYVVLLLNKADLENKHITEDDINGIEELRDIERYEVSAKTGENVFRAFTETIAKVLIKESSKLL